MDPSGRSPDERNKTMRLSFLMLLVLGAGAAFSQETNVLAPFEPQVGVFPSTKEEIWKWAIPIITLLAMQGIKQIPKLPDWIIPYLTPVAGILLGLGLSYLKQLNLGWVDLGSMGALSTWLHQTIMQTATRAQEGKSLPKGPP